MRDEIDHSTIHGRSTGTLNDYINRILSPLDWINQLEGRITAFSRARKRKCKKTSGALGVARDFVESAIGANTRTIYVSRESCSGRDIERMLRGYGIKIGARSVPNELTIGFEVSEQQAKFAEYLICRYVGGVKGGMIDSDNLRRAAKHPGSSMPRRWKDNKKRKHK